ncbi:MAG: type II toxin-antitoxin system death-on-curing family toxin [Planctomycetes bacterium]|nr:type II toxin-antitoxin system death-on-curing family toxin [Planctomycetota bacterium]
MTRYLTLREVLDLYLRVMEQSGGLVGVRDMGALEAVVAQPRITFGGEELYPTLVEKASAIGFSLIMNHPFLDGNKRAGHAAMEAFLLLNGHEIAATVDEQESLLLAIVSSGLSREELASWLRAHVVPACPGRGGPRLGPGGGEVSSEV